LSVEHFDDLTEADLRENANQCFAEARIGVGRDIHATACLLQAGFYVSEITRRHESKVVRRDFILELIIIGLIVAEVVFGIIEGNKQATILNKMETSMEAMALAAGVQSKGLGKLIEEQGESLNSLEKMNGQLQDSMKNTGDMARAMKQQLKILQDEQSARQSELAKKPRLEIYVENVPLNSLTGANFEARESTITKLTFDVVLRNSGNAMATKGLLRVIAFAKDVSLASNMPSQPIYDVEKDSPQHGILIPFDYIRPNVRIPMSVTFTFPAGQQPFSVYFNVDADEIPTATPLGSMIARPLKP
jgi:hypothetical protein